jgi:hypothetical protein
MSVYLQLYHGRQDPKEQLDDWGFEGPILGPFPFVHMTYMTTISVGDGPSDELEIDKEGLISYQGCLYGDFSVIGDLKGPTDEFQKRWEETQKVLKTTQHDWPLMIHDKETWIQVYVKQQLAKESPIEKASVTKQTHRRRK